MVFLDCKVFTVSFNPRLPNREMEILWLAIILYSLGLGLVLHFRPTLMFNENGTWKEFGYQRSQSRHTLFPFWLFALVWAFASYVIATALVWTMTTSSSVAVPVAAAAAASYWSEQEDEMEPEDEETIEVPVKRSRGRPRKTVKPGYYVIDPSSEKSGLHRYVYYGQEPPTA
jgi:hypothetical protein